MFPGYAITKEAARHSGLSVSQIRRLLGSGKIRGAKIGRDWLVELASLDLYLVSRPERGRKRGKKPSQ